jgi:hypothetical protein
MGEVPLYASLPMKGVGAYMAAVLGYRGYSKVRTHTALGPYGSSMPRSIGPPWGRDVFLNSSNPVQVYLAHMKPHPPRVITALSFSLASTPCV